MRPALPTMSALFSRSFRDEAREYCRLAWPIAAAQISFVSMSAVDTVLAGRLGAAQLAAVAVGANVFFLMFVFFSGLLMAVSPIVAQARGAQRPLAEIGAFLRGALLFALLAGLGWIALLWWVREPVLRLLALDTATQDFARGYMHTLLLAPLPFCLSFVQRNGADAHGLTRLSLVAGVVALGVNTVLAYGLMYGRLGMPEIGPAGAGYATAAGGAAMVLVYALQYRLTPALHALRLLAPCAWPWRAAARQILRLGLPSAAILSAEASLFQIGALLMSRFGGTAMAAHQIAINVASLSFMVPLSIGLAATVRVGLAAGAGDAAAAALRGRVGIVLSVAFALLAASVMALSPQLIARAYTTDAGVARLAASFLAYAAVFQLFDCVQATANGALRGIKDTRGPMLITVAAYWIVGLPLAVALAYYSPVGPAGIWCGFIGGLSIAAFGLSWRFLSRTRRQERAAMG